MLTTRATTAFSLVTGILVVAVSVSACVPIVPTRPSFVEPISLTVVDDQLAWVQCTGADVEIYYASMTVGEANGDSYFVYYRGENGPPSIAAEDSRPIAPADLVGLPLHEENEVLASTLDAPISVGLRVTGDEFHAEMSYRDITPADVIDGMYAYSSGEIGTDPCGMETTD